MRRRVQTGRAPHLRGEAEVDGELGRMAQCRTHQGHLPLVLGEGKTMTIMAIKTDELEGFVVMCDACEYQDDEQEGEISVYDNPEAAVTAVKDADWLAEYGKEGDLAVLCPECREGVR